MTVGTTSGTPTTSQLVRLGLVMLVVLFALCSIFAAVVTGAEAWEEHAQARWPEVTARVERCGLDRTSTGRREGFYIHCRLSYAVGTERNVASIYSAHVPSRNVWQYPPNQIQPFANWVNEHPAGKRIAVRYDPARHGKVVLVADYMPRGGPRTASNIKLLLFFAGGFAVLLAVVRVTRPRSVAKSGYSSMPVSR